MTHYTSVGQNARLAARPGRHTARMVCAGASIAAFGLYLASPFLTLWSIGSSLKTHDMVSLGQMINWGELDTSIKQQAMAGMHLLPAAADDLPEFGSSFATEVVSNAVDINVSQQNLGTLVDEVLPASAQEHATHNLSFASLISQATFHFERPDLFVALVHLPGHENETPLEIDMRIQHWQWKVTSINFPAPRPRTMTASAAPGNA